MSRSLPLTHKKFNRLYVLKRVKERAPSGQVRWLCRCDCGNEVIVAGPALVGNHTKSCGCLNAEVRASGQNSTTHGYTYTPEYDLWRNIKARCFNPHASGYQYYGARGITMCAVWRDSFETFLADVGHRPSPQHSIDRINNDGNYEPGNVRWATPSEQANNRRAFTPREKGTND